MTDERARGGRDGRRLGGADAAIARVGLDVDGLESPGLQIGSHEVIAGGVDEISRRVGHKRAGARQIDIARRAEAPDVSQTTK